MNIFNRTACNFIFALDARQNNHLNRTSALLREHGRPELKVKKLEDLELKNSHPHKFLYQIELRDPLQPQRSVPVEVGHFKSRGYSPL